MATKEWKVMAHAVRRYLERYAPGKSEGEARVELLRLAYDSVRLPERTHAGDSIFQADGHLRLVTKETKENNICMTIIPGLTQMEAEIMREAARDLPVIPPAPRYQPGYRSREQREASKAEHIESLQRQIAKLNRQLKVARAFMTSLSGLKGKEAREALVVMKAITGEEEKEEVRK